MPSLGLEVPPEYWLPIFPGYSSCSHHNFPYNTQKRQPSLNSASSQVAFSTSATAPKGRSHGKADGLPKPQRSLLTAITEFGHRINKRWNRKRETWREVQRHVTKREKETAERSRELPPRARLQRVGIAFACWRYQPCSISLQHGETVQTLSFLSHQALWPFRWPWFFYNIPPLMLLLVDGLFPPSARGPEFSAS